MKKLLVTSWFILSLFLLLSSTGISEILSGKVTSVADGDTITILTQAQRQIKIRLYGIDTPESSQAFGQKEKKFTSSLTYGKHVEVVAYDIDKYGRTVGVVLVNGVNVNEEIVRNGYAWQYRKYCKESFCSDWIGLEKAAKQSRIGLWHDNDPIASLGLEEGQEECCRQSKRYYRGQVSR